MTGRHNSGSLREKILSMINCQEEKDALKRLQAKTAAELSALLPAILDKAFKGVL